jgi:ATP-dependent DNA helicase RecG
MTEEELKIKLEEFRRLPAETEVFEFKEARNNYDSNKLGKYFSALSNEANLKGKSHAWLIFGIKDKGRTIVGSQFLHSRKDLDSLKGELANKTTNRISFIEIYELHLPEGRIVMFHIPAAPKGIPVAFDGHYYGREGEKLSPLNLEEIERIRSLIISVKDFFQCRNMYCQKIK